MGRFGQSGSRGVKRLRRRVLPFLKQPPQAARLILNQMPAAQQALVQRLDLVLQAQARIKGPLPFKQFLPG